MDPEQFDNLDELLNAAEEEQKALLQLNNNLRKVISVTISEKFPKLISPDSENIEKIKILAIKASKSITHDVHSLLNTGKELF
jgi:hypothetical protein